MMTDRQHAGLGFLAAVAALAFVYYLQYVRGLEPCPLCIFQRIAMAAVGLVCLFWLVHDPATIGRRIYAALAALAALAGAGIAARHVWLMHLPPDQVPACGPGLDYLIDIMPLREVVATVLRGDASCATVKGAFLGVSLPAWSCIYFTGLLLWNLVGVFRAPTRPRPEAESSHS